MNQVTAKTHNRWDIASLFPIIKLLNPRHLAPAVIASIAVGFAAAWLVVAQLALPLWMATLVFLLVMLPVGIFKWRDDLRRYGKTSMLVSILLVAQGTHTIEHVTQFVQYYLLNLPARQSNGLLSPANSEWVHFVWNWLVLITVLLLIKGGVRNFWAFMLLGIAIGHTFEHTYMFVRYQIVLDQLNVLCVPNVTAQGLPGILGRDGWLARSDVTQSTFIGSLPGLTTAMRIDVHFWWNIAEMLTFAAAAHVFLRKSLPNG